nr:galectin-related protein precursor [Biomphalaria glabrata]
MFINTVLALYLSCFVIWPVLCCSPNFLYYPNMQLEGCQDGQPFKTSTMIPWRCLHHTNCTALLCDTPMTRCSPCMAGGITGLSFSNSSGVYLKRKLVKMNLAYNTFLYTEGTSPIPSYLVPGDMIYLRATILKYDTLTINLFKDSQIYYHARARCDDYCAESITCDSIKCSKKFYVVNSYYNGHWGSEIRTYQYDMLVNQVFEWHILINAQSVDWYINRAHVCRLDTITTYRPVLLQVAGTALVHELSL